MLPISESPLSMPARLQSGRLLPYSFALHPTALLDEGDKVAYTLTDLSN